MTKLRIVTGFAAAISGVAMTFGFTGASADEPSALQDRKIGFVLTHKSFAVWTSPDGKKECPQGFNFGPREDFKALYPEGGDYAGTVLEREGEVVLPGTAPVPGVVYREPVVKTALGLNLDGKIDANDFTSPSGEQGIDNEMYRVIGCTESYRGPDGSVRFFVEDYMRKFYFNRWIVELTEVDDLTNDREVKVAIYRGMDPLTKDAGGNFVSGGTQRIDLRWGQKFIYKTTGKIEGGVLTTAPVDILFPESMQRGLPYQSVRDWRLKLSLTSDGAEGVMAGYLDFERWHRTLSQNWATHNRSYGAEAVQSQYRALREHADAYPDPKTGQNTHISAAWDLKFSQAFVLHPPETVAEVDGPVGDPRPASRAGRER